jgi:hypothetical protein
MADHYVFEHHERPWTTNAERSMHRMKRAALVKEWRTAFYWLGTQSKAKRLNPCHIEAFPVQPDRRWMADVGACLPAVKAAVDGLVDAGVLDDDTPEHVLSIRFWPAEVVPGAKPSLRVVVTPVEESSL